MNLKRDPYEFKRDELICPYELKGMSLCELKRDPCESKRDPG